jgi:hypothetical protein
VATAWKVVEHYVKLRATENGYPGPADDLVGFGEWAADRIDAAIRLEGEAICAFGRLGTMFACEKYCYTPDLLACAEGIAAGGGPLEAMPATCRPGDRGAPVIRLAPQLTCGPTESEHREQILRRTPVAADRGVRGAA